MRTFSYLSLLALLMAMGCQTQDLKPQCGLAAHWQEMLAAPLPCETVERLQQAAREDTALYPYLRDYILGEVGVAIDPILRRRLHEWETVVCKQGVQPCLCTAIGDMTAQLTEIEVAY